MNWPLVCTINGRLDPLKIPSNVSFFLFPSKTLISHLKINGYKSRRLNMVNFNLTVWLDGAVMIHVQSYMELFLVILELMTPLELPTS